MKAAIPVLALATLACAQETASLEMLHVRGNVYMLASTLGKIVLSATVRPIAGSFAR